MTKLESLLLSCIVSAKVVQCRARPFAQPGAEVRRFDGVVFAANDGCDLFGAGRAVGAVWLAEGGWRQFLLAAAARLWRLHRRVILFISQPV